MREETFSSEEGSRRAEITRFVQGINISYIHKKSKDQEKRRQSRRLYIEGYVETSQGEGFEEVGETQGI